jgi:hypothetical protein
MAFKLTNKNQGAAMLSAITLHYVTNGKSD